MHSLAFSGFKMYLSVASFEDLLGEHRQIDAPVAPDVTSVGLDVLILVALGIPVVAQVNGAIVEEVGLSHAHLVKFGLAAEQFCRLLGEVRVAFDLLGERLVPVEVLAQVQTG